MPPGLLKAPRKYFVVSKTMEKAQEMRQPDRPTKIITREKDVEICNDPSSGSEDDSNFHNEITIPASRSRDGGGSTNHNLPKVSKSQTHHSSLSEELHHLRSEHKATLKELKLSHRENRDQSLEMRDLKKSLAHTSSQLTHLRSKNTQLRSDVDSARNEKLSKSEKEDYISQFETLESHISRLQHERSRRENYLESLTERMREANEQKGALENEARKLQRQVGQLSENLTECRDDLLRLQPMNQGVPDSEIADEYANLDQEITGWVDDRTEDSEFLERRFDKMKSFDDVPKLFREYLSGEQVRMAKRYPESQPIVVRYLIHRALSSSILNEEVYLFGLDQRTIALLKGLEEGMTLLEPRRDTIILRRWRSETLQSLLQMPNFISEQARQAELLSQTLYSALSQFLFPSTTTNTFEDASSSPDFSTLHTRLVLPTVHLANKLRLSTSNYTITQNPSAKENTTAFIYSLKETSMIDIVTQKILRPDSALKVREDGRIGDEMLVVVPALLRAHGDAKGGVLICKPVVLVKLDEPMGRRNRGIKALGAWTPSWFGVEQSAAS